MDSELESKLDDLETRIMLIETMLRELLARQEGAKAVEEVQDKFDEIAELINETGNPWYPYAREN